VGSISAACVLGHGWLNSLTVYGCPARRSAAMFRIVENPDPTDDWSWIL